MLTSILLLAPQAVRILQRGAVCHATDKTLGPEVSISEMTSPLKEYWHMMFDSPAASTLSSIKSVTWISLGKSKVWNGWRFLRWYRAKRGPPPATAHSAFMLADPIHFPKFERLIFVFLYGSSVNETFFSLGSQNITDPSSDPVTTNFSLQFYILSH